MSTNAPHFVSLDGVVETPEQVPEATTTWTPPTGAGHTTIGYLPSPPAGSSLRHDERAEARRWVRRKRILYTILGIYAVLSLMWFAIDMADGTESLWFYWPMMGTGIGVAVTAIVLLGVGGVFGVDWERRQVEQYLRRHG